MIIPLRIIYLFEMQFHYQIYELQTFSPIIFLSGIVIFFMVSFEVLIQELLKK